MAAEILVLSLRLMILVCRVCFSPCFSDLLLLAIFIPVVKVATWRL